MTDVTLDDVRAAAARIAGHVHRTPVHTCAALDDATGAKLFFKCENFQRAGAFKARGAANAVLALAECDAARGVVTHSSGNHGAALALAARGRGIACTVVVPRTAPAAKLAAMRGYGARLVECEPSFAAREAACAAVMAETGATLVHPFDDRHVIAGQGTAALELLADAPGLDAVTVPVGGGGLLGGVAVAAKGLDPAIRVVAAEPAEADDAHRSRAAGAIQPAVTPPRSVADGLLGQLSPRTFALMQAHCDDIVTVSEAEIVAAMKLVWQRMKIIIEPSCAVPVAALIERRWDAAGRRVGVILTGGNVDLDRLPW